VDVDLQADVAAGGETPVSMRTRAMLEKDIDTIGIFLSSMTAQLHIHKMESWPTSPKHKCQRNIEWKTPAHPHNREFASLAWWK
jgi:hypothetical protein